MRHLYGWRLLSIPYWEWAAMRHPSVDVERRQQHNYLMQAFAVGAYNAYIVLYNVCRIGAAAALPDTRLCGRGLPTAPILYIPCFMFHTLRSGPPYRSYCPLPPASPCDCRSYTAYITQHNIYSIGFSLRLPLPRLPSLTPLHCHW